MHIFFTLIVVSFTTIIVWLFIKYRPSKNNKVSIIYTDALNAMLSANRPKAIKLLKDVVKKDSNHVEAYLQLGNIIREDNPNHALKIHQTLTVRSNLSKYRKIELAKSLANDYEKIGDIAKARKEAEKILKLDKNNEWAIRFLIEASEKLKDWSYASDKQSHLQRVLGIEEPNQLAKYLVFKAEDYITEGKYTNAEQLLEKSIKQAPNYGLPYKFLGNIKMIDRDLVKAIEYWNMYSDMSDEKTYLIFDDMESALFDLGRYSEVEKFYRKILKKNPNDIIAGIKLANVLNEKGEEQSAINLIDDFIKNGNERISVLLMKLKLSISIKTPAELGYQIDHILKKIDSSDS